jgi:hypothetical protein
MKCLCKGEMYKDGTADEPPVPRGMPGCDTCYHGRLHEFTAGVQSRHRCDLTYTNPACECMQYHEVPFRRRRNG